MRQEIASLVVEKGWGLLELTPVTRSLEDIYLEATRRLDAPGSAAGDLSSSEGGTTREVATVTGDAP